MKKKLLTPEHIEFNRLVALITDVYTKTRIAQELNIINEAKHEADLATFNKIENGTLSSHDGIYIQEFNDKLKAVKDFKDILTPTAGSVTDFTSLFLLYYWSSDNTLSLAAIGVNSEDENKNSFIYFSKNNSGAYEIHKTRKVTSFHYIPHKVIEIVVQKKSSGPKIFITVDLCGNEIEDVTFAYCSYCGSMGSSNGAFGGIGIIEKIGISDFSKRIDKIAKEFPYSIVNAIYNRRHNVNDSEIKVYEDVNKIRNKQTKTMKKIFGFWVGYYPRKHIEKEGIIGGIAKALMFIDKSGEVKFYFRSDHTDGNIIPDYEGIIRFPYSAETKIIVGEFEQYKGVPRMRLLLDLAHNNLTGSMSGWRHKDNIHFTRAIFFENVLNTEVDNYTATLQSLIGKHQPGPYTINDYLLIKDKIKTLRQIQDKVIHTIDNCISGIQPSKQLNIFGDQSQ